MGEQDVAEGLFHGFTDLYFPADGGRVWALFWTNDIYESSIFEARLGRGLPGDLHFVPDLPHRGSFVWPVFSADSKRAWIADDYTGMYVLDFETPAPAGYRGRFLSGSAEFNWYDEPQFCRDSRVLWVPAALPSSHEPNAATPTARLVTIRPGAQLVEHELGPGVTDVDPQGDLVSLSSADRVVLLSCESEPQVFPLSDQGWELVSFRGGGKYVHLDNLQNHQIYSVAHPAAPVLVYSCSDCDVTWDASERFIDAQLMGAQLWLELDGDSYAVERNRPPALDEELALLVQDEGERSVLLQGPEVTIDAEAETTSEFGIVHRDDPDGVVPIVRQGRHPPGVLEWSNVDAGLALVRRDDPVDQLWLLRFQELPFTEELVAEPGGYPRFAVSPDLRGFAFTGLLDGLPLKQEAVFQPFAPGGAPVGLGVAGIPWFGPAPQ